jgi:hypothetical protein
MIGALALEMISATWAHLPTGAVGVAADCTFSGGRSSTLGPRDVLGKVDEAAAGLLGLRRLECLAHDLGDDFGRADLGRILGDRLEQVHQIEDLVALLVHPGRCALTGDRDNGGAIHVGVGDPRYQVGRARSKRRQAHPGPPRQPAVDVGHEGRALLVAGQNEADRAVDQGIKQIDVLLAWQPEDVFNPFVLEAFRE